MKSVFGYKFVSKDLQSKENSFQWKKNKWFTHEGDIELCKNGFHACLTPLQSLAFIYGNRWFVIEAKGKIFYGDNKFVASSMRLVRELPVKEILVDFSLKCAWRVLKNFEKRHPADKRPRKALVAARRYINNPSEKNLELLKIARSAARSAESAARYAARSAAWSAESAEYAARSAAWSAESAEYAARSAESAARYAARSAAWSAESAEYAARSAAREWQNKTLKKIIQKHTQKRKHDD